MLRATLKFRFLYFDYVGVGAGSLWINWECRRPLPGIGFVIKYPRAFWTRWVLLICGSVSAYLSSVLESCDFP